jgi:hypothetical protein
MGARFRRAAVVAGFFCLGLAGCQDTASAPAPEAAVALAPEPFVKREGVSLADATAAVASIDGAPDVATQDFRDALARQFASRGIASAPEIKARYRLRVYLSARPDDGGAALDYVVDVYDAARVRRARLGDSFTIKGSGDAWSLMSRQALDAVAAACADNVAAFLSNTPEAKPAEAMSAAQ